MNFNFDFLDLHDVVFESYYTSPINLLDRSFLKQFKTFAVRVLSELKILGFVLSELKILGFASYLRYIW